MHENFRGDFKLFYELTKIYAAVNFFNWQYLKKWL